MLVLITGLPGTGKSTIAMHLARRLRATVLRTDVIRKQLFPEPKYTEEEKELVYKVTFMIAEYLLRAGKNVILDGTFYRRSLRERVYRLARAARTKLIIVECSAPEFVVRQRMEARAKKKNLPTDADFDVYLKIRSQFEPLRRPRVIVDTSNPLEENLAEIMRYIRSRTKAKRRSGRRG
ncbi:AAA family ATPase [Candidatus Pyrohabitans sp.]